MARTVRKFSFLKSWYSIYTFTLFGALPFLLSFVWGNHDWGWIKEGTPLWSGVFEGRFSQFILPTILFSGNILPILSIACALAMLSITAFLLIKLWQVPKKYIFYILLGLNITLAPYTISWFYFNFIVLSCLSWTCIITLGFYVLFIPSLNKTLSYILAVTLFTLALGGYPPCINMIGVILFTLLLKDLSLNTYTIKSLILKYLPCIITILAAALFFLGIQHELKIHHLQYDTYNTAGITFSNLPAKLLLCLKLSLQQFINKTSFINSSYKYTMLGLCLLVLIELSLNLKKSYLKISAFILLLLGLLLSSITTTLVAENTHYVLYEPRIEFFSLPYIYTFAAAVLLSSKKQFFRNITILILTLTFLQNINTMAHASKIWNLGFKAETNLSERIVSRIENHPNFHNENNFYTFVQGDVVSIRPKYYQAAPNEIIDSYTVTAPFIPWHLPTKVYTFYYPNNFINKDFDVYWRFISPYEIPVNTSVIQYINEKSFAWPHKNAIYIDDTLIIIIMNKDGENYAKQWLQNNNYK